MASQIFECGWCGKSFKELFNFLHHVKYCDERFELSGAATHPIVYNKDRNSIKDKVREVENAADRSKVF